MDAPMDNDPISQLPEPYRAAWNVLYGAGDLENISKNIIESAIKIADADWGMIVFKSDSSPYHYLLPFVRTLPDTTPGIFDDRNVSLIVYLLACRTMRNERSEIVLDTDHVSLQDKQDMIKEFLREWTVKPANESNDENEDHQSLLLVPIISGRTVVGTIVLRHSAVRIPFTNRDLSAVELFAALIAESLNSIVTLSDLDDINKHILSFIIYETPNPLKSIRGYSELLLDTPKFGELNDKQVEFVKKIHKNCERLKHVISNSYYLSRLESDRANAGNGKFDISEIVLKKYEELKENFKDKKQNVHLDFENTIPAQGDRLWVDYAVEAFMKNACSNSPKESDINVSIKILNELVRVSVSDHGIGLTDEEKNHLFQKFYRSERARFDYGTGLDLFIAKHYIEKMGGQIGAEGSPDQGSTFWFTLPVAKE